MYQLITEYGLDDTEFTADGARAAPHDMIRVRRFNERTFTLRRRDWMNGYPPFRGQKAPQIGATHTVRDDDVLLLTYRSNALQLARGVPPSDILLFRCDHAEYASDHDVSVFPQAVPIVSQIPHATGVGMTTNYRSDDRVALVYFDDGTTSGGDFHEGLNFAGVFDASVVFFRENSGWAISLPRERQTAGGSIAAKADAYGMDGTQVDNSDPLTVRKTVKRGFEKARAGEPVLIESPTYRQGSHTTTGGPSCYRDDEPGLPEWWTRDPLDCFKSFCREAGVVDNAALDAMRNDADKELREAVERVETTPEPGTNELFDNVYEELPSELARQREGHVAFVERAGPFDIER